MFSYLKWKGKKKAIEELQLLKSLRKNILDCMNKIRDGFNYNLLKCHWWSTSGVDARADTV